MAEATMIIDNKKIEIYTDKILLTDQRDPTTLKSMVLNISRTEMLTLAAAIKEAAKK